MSQCMQCGKQNPESLGNKPRKHCSKKCAQKFYHQNTYVKKHKDWGTKTAKRMQEREKRRDEFEWHKNNWLTATQLAEKLGITSTAVHHRAKELKVEGKLIPKPEGGSTRFWNPEDIEKLKYKETPIPEGYITRAEVCQLLNIKKNTFVSGGYHKKIKPDMLWQQTHGMRNTQHLYLKSNIEKYIKDKEAAVEARKMEIKAREQERIRRVAAAEAARADARARREKERLDRQLQREADKVANYERRLQRQRDRIPNADYDWQSVKHREHKLFNSFERKLSNWHEGKNHSLVSLEKAIESNKRYAKRLNDGFITEFSCSNCSVTQPYYNFYFTETKKGRATNMCRQCLSNKAKKHWALNKESIKEKTKKNYRLKFRTLIAGTIKQDLARHRGYWAEDISNTLIWSKLQEKCGYDLDDFIEHIQNQFNEKMNWFNHGRGSDQYYWQIDHIVPRSNFVYTDLDDPAFISCWSLTNMQPLSQYENMTKDNPISKGINPFTKEKI
jgi:biotin operon repressor